MGDLFSKPQPLPSDIITDALTQISYETIIENTIKTQDNIATQNIINAECEGDNISAEGLERAVESCYKYIKKESCADLRYACVVSDISQKTTVVFSGTLDTSDTTANTIIDKMIDKINSKLSNTSDGFTNALANLTGNGSTVSPNIRTRLQNILSNHLTVRNVKEMIVSISTSNVINIKVKNTGAKYTKINQYSAMDVLKTSKCISGIVNDITTNLSRDMTMENTQQSKGLTDIVDSITDTIGSFFSSAKTIIIVVVVVIGLIFIGILVAIVKSLNTPAGATLAEAAAKKIGGDGSGDEF